MAQELTFATGTLFRQGGIVCQVTKGSRVNVKYVKKHTDDPDNNTWHVARKETLRSLKAVGLITSA